MVEPGTALLIDIGNSRVKWGWASRSRIEPGEPFATSASLDEFPRRWAGLPAPAQVVAANVAGAGIGDSLKAFTEQRWGLAPRFVHSQAQAFGISNGYTNPEKLGVYRWLALIGARQAGTGPWCVADCGTAITVDALDAEGRHLGGLIAPGLALMRAALARGTHALPLAGTDAEVGLARDTAAAIANGARQAAAGLVERAFRDTARRLGVAPRLLLTGGDAPVIGADLEISHDIKPQLVLEGLYVIAQGN